MGTPPWDEFMLERTALVECYSQFYNKGSDHVHSLSSFTGIVVLGPGPKCPQRRESAKSVPQHSPPVRHLQPLQACGALCRWFSLIIPTLQMRRLRLKSRCMAFQGSQLENNAFRFKPANIRHLRLALDHWTTLSGIRSKPRGGRAAPDPDLVG